MPQRKKQTDETVDDASSIKEHVVKDSDENKQTASENDTIAETAKSATEEDSGGQLFFSTDGSEPEKGDENPYLETADAKTQSDEEKPSAKPSENPEVLTKEENKEQESPRNHQNNKPNRGPHPNNPKKQNWQDKKKQRNKQRQKFKNLDACHMKKREQNHLNWVNF